MQSNDIEDRFTNAVKAALETPRSVVPSSEMTAGLPQLCGHTRAHQWLVAALYMTLTATVAIIVAAALLR